MRELSLFTGAGGGVLGSILLGWNVIGYVEYDEYCQQIIRQRIKDGIYDDAPIFGDIKGFDGKPWRGVVDIITAGFPCQPFSVAGKRAGADDDRNLWPETLRVLSEVRPRYAFLENVPGLISSGYFGTILGDLASIGYDAEWCVLGADDVGAPHRRKRLWILAHAAVNRDSGAPGSIRRSQQGQELHLLGEPVESGDVPDPTIEGLQGGGLTQGGEIRSYTSESGQRISWWDTDPAEVCNPNGSGFTGDDNGEPQRKSEEGHSTREGPTQPRLGRVAYGVARRVDRLKAIGNGQVPRVAAAAWHLLMRNVVRLTY